jgi:Ser/Thr protein kinase RdoA (MazF antagonist)
MAEDALAAARYALTEWDIDVASLEAASLTENIVFRVSASDGANYVLRLHRPGYHTLDELLSEQKWTAALMDAGIDVPVPRATRSGAGYTGVDVAGEHRYAGVLEWVEGKTMSSLIEKSVEPDFTTTRFSQLGEIIATLHNQATEWDPPPGFTRHSFDSDGLMGEKPFWGRFWESPEANAKQQGALATLRNRIYKVLTSFSRERELYSLIHADLHPGNIIVHGERLHLIDFDDAGFGWHAYDLAVALTMDEQDTDFDTISEALYAGYRKHRQLDERTLSAVPLFLLVRALVQTGWFAGRPEHKDRSYAPELIAYAIEHADEVLANFT